MIDFYKVGIKIASYRKALGLSQDELAEKIYVSRQLISKWENGTGVPTIDGLLNLCQIFGVSFEEILSLDDKAEFDSENLFKHHTRDFVMNSIIDGSLKINLADYFYQFSNDERMRLLALIKVNLLEVDMNELYPKLTQKEQMYLRRIK